MANIDINQKLQESASKVLDSLSEVLKSVADPLKQGIAKLPEVIQHLLVEYSRYHLMYGIFWLVPALLGLGFGIFCFVFMLKFHKNHDEDSCIFTMIGTAVCMLIFFFSLVAAAPHFAAWIAPEIHIIDTYLSTKR